MSLVQSIVNKAFQSALLIYKEKIAQHTFHLRLKLSRPLDHYQAGQHLRILVGLDRVLAFRDLVRTYSVWHYTPANLELDLAVCTFSSGQGAQWAHTINIGDTVYFGGPKGKFVVDASAATYFFLGDVSALGPLYELARQLPSNKAIHGVVHARDTADFFEDKFSNLAFQFIPLNGPAALPTRALVEQVDFDPAQTIVYIAGEALFCKAMHRYFRTTHFVPPKQLYTKPFWHPNKKGLE